MSFFKTSDGLSIHYEVRGTGTPLLLLPGLTRNKSDFDFVLPFLTGVQVIRMDPRGRGQSDYDSDFMNYAIPVEARDVVELLDHLGIEKAATIGTSRGGILSMFLAATAKERLIGTILNDIGPVLDRDGITYIMDYLGRRPRYKTYEEAAADYPNRITGFPNVPPARWMAEVQNLWDIDERGLALRYDPKLRDALEALDHQGGNDGDMWPLFESFADLPLALIHGENSYLLTDETAAEMRKRRPDMIYARVQDRGHIPWLDEPESLSAIEQFLEQIR